jgi:hypothetical protein
VDAFASGLDHHDIPEDQLRQERQEVDYHSDGLLFVNSPMSLVVVP